MTARSKVWVCGRLLAEIAGSNPTGGLDVCSDCCVLSGREASATDPSLAQRSPTDCGVSECVTECYQVQQ